MSRNRGARASAVAASDRTVTPDEARAYLSTPVSPAEYEGVLELVSWFRRRYTTGAERLAYVRCAYRRWSNVLSAPASDDPDAGRD